MHRPAIRIAALPAALLLSASLLACATVPAGGQAAIGSNVHAPDDNAAIRAVLDTTAAGWNRGDLAAYMSAYADSTTSMGPDGLIHGKAATERVMREGFWRAGRPAQQLRYDHIEVRMLGDDHALVTGEFILSGAGRPDRTGWFSTTWARTSRGWLMIHDHSG